MNNKNTLSIKDFINAFEAKEADSNYLNIDGWIYSIRDNVLFLRHFKNGVIHNSNGPAELIVSLNPNKSESVFENIIAYYINGKIHNDKGPAIIGCFCEVVYSDNKFFPKDSNEVSSEFWYKNGLRHRVEGPAYASEKFNLYSYWIKDKMLMEEDFNLHSEVVFFKNKDLLKKKMHNLSNNIKDEN